MFVQKDIGMQVSGLSLKQFKVSERFVSMVYVLRIFIMLSANIV